MEKYLSATVVQEKLKELCDRYSVQYGSHYDSFGKAIAEFADNLPEADVNEDVHGEWIETNYWYSNYCSICNEKNEGQTNYCPSCGAKMEMQKPDEVTNEDVMEAFKEFMHQPKMIRR